MNLYVQLLNIMHICMHTNMNLNHFNLKHLKIQVFSLH